MDVKKSASLTGRIVPLLQSCFQALAAEDTLIRIVMQLTPIIQSHIEHGASCDNEQDGTRLAD